MKLLVAIFFVVFVTALSQHRGTRGGSTPETNQSLDTNQIQVECIGRLSTVHRKGDASPKVKLADVFDSVGFWAIGPLAGLRGEITVIESRPFIAMVNDDTITVSHNTDVEAPFLVYGTVRRWQVTDVPDSVRSIPQLELWLAFIADSIGTPGTLGVFPFKITSSQSDIDFHVISNREPGYQISRPHHELMRHFTLHSQPVTLLGVYSKEHAGIFTHHDQWTHIHFVSADNRSAGHVDSLSLGSDAMLFLPEVK